MDQKQIDRINELSRKARSPEGLPQWEEQERFFQNVLRLLRS